MSIWTDSVAIVTGGASGLGNASVRALSERGMKVAIFDLNKELGLSEAAEIGASYYAVDVSDPSSISIALDLLEKDLGTPRVLVNCAGIGPAAKTVSRGQPHDPAMFAKVIHINLLGTFYCASQVAARMAAVEPLDDDGARGVIVNTSSVAAYEGQVGQVAYSTSKGGIVGMTLPMARDLADKGIRVCAVAPGLFLTPLLSGMPQEVQDSLGGQVPFPSRLGKPEEYASMVCHIIDNPMLNGEVIRLDGAIRMAPR
ncbi:MAG: NAD(P)-dependent dehydrogenase (short-subunit alcohol dehydrogenase family) [Granulosicoccus sp.]|jgi:NAD(P)-dependent dehydrogenase (short-subunit alcohol dehydrogenase family)